MERNFRLLGEENRYNDEKLGKYKEMEYQQRKECIDERKDMKYR